MIKGGPDDAGERSKCGVSGAVDSDGEDRARNALAGGVQCSAGLAEESLRGMITAGLIVSPTASSQAIVRPLDDSLPGLGVWSSTSDVLGVNVDGLPGSSWYLELSDRGESKQAGSLASKMSSGSSKIHRETMERLSELLGTRAEGTESTSCNRGNPELCDCGKLDLAATSREGLGSGGETDKEREISDDINSGSGTDIAGDFHESGEMMGEESGTFGISIVRLPSSSNTSEGTVKTSSVDGSERGSGTRTSEALKSGDRGRSEACGSTCTSERGGQELAHGKRVLENMGSTSEGTEGESEDGWNGAGVLGDMDPNDNAGDSRGGLTHSVDDEGNTETSGGDEGSNDNDGEVGHDAGKPSDDEDSDEGSGGPGESESRTDNES